MRGVVWAALAAAAAAAVAAPAHAQEGGPIRTGEHGDFTRVVMIVEPTTEWSLETGPGAATIFFPGRRLAFGTAGAFDRIPRTRVTAIETAVGSAGTRVEIAVGCDCRVSTSFVGARYLALDVRDREAAEPLAEDPVLRERREASAVASAEAALIQQITRAADQGIVRLSREATGDEDDDRAAPAPASAGLRTPDSQGAVAGAGKTPGTIADLAQHDQIAAITVFDRDSAAIAALRPTPETPLVCLPDAAFDVGAWTNGGPLHAQTPALMRRIVGEFDRADPEAIRDLARLYVRFGFGAEAEALLAAFDVEIEERALLADLARAVEGRPVSVDGPLALDEPCPGRHGLWLAAGGDAPAFHDVQHFATIQSAYAELPADLRALVAPQLMLRLLEAGRPEEARLIHLTAARTGEAPSADMLRALARLAAADGRVGDAEIHLRELIDGNAANATDALIDLARLALDQGLALPDPLATDLAATALTQRGDPREARLRGLLVETLAARGALAPALAEARAAIADLPAASPSLVAVAAAALATADPDQVGHSVYASVVLANADLLPTTRSGDPARRAVAARLVDIGLPNAAVLVLAPAVLRGDAGALRLTARAYLALGAPGEALAAVGALDDPEAVQLRAEALARADSPSAAVELLASFGAEVETATYAWSSGDWARAVAASQDTDRAAMARYMAGRAGAPASGGDANPPDETQAGFMAPLPTLDAPSLGAARQLLSAGPQVERFLKGVLNPPDAPAAAD